MVRCGSIHTPEEKYLPGLTRNATLSNDLPEEKHLPGLTRNATLSGELSAGVCAGARVSGEQLGQLAWSRVM